MLAERGWGVRDGLEVSTSIDRYRDYIGDSRGEFTVAKEQNVRLRTGWFSDRSATYLASGRPVITQETGFANVLPTGEGLFGFDSLRAGPCGCRGDQLRDYTAPRQRRPASWLRSTSATRWCCGRCSRRWGSTSAAGRQVPPSPAAFPSRACRWSRSPGARRCWPRDTVEAASEVGLPVTTKAGCDRRAPRAPASSSSLTTTWPSPASASRASSPTPATRLRADRRRQRLQRRHSPPTSARLAERHARVRVHPQRHEPRLRAGLQPGPRPWRRETHLVLLNNDTIVPPGWLAGLQPPPRATPRSAWSGRSRTGSATRPRSTSTTRPGGSS